MNRVLSRQIDVFAPRAMRQTLVAFPESFITDNERRIVMADYTSNSNSNPDRKSSARKRAQNHFQAAEVRDTLVRQMIAKERAASDAKTAKLRALRLAKEAADREAGIVPEAEKPAPKPKRNKAKA